jgi:hypothetical protein
MSEGQGGLLKLLLSAGALYLAYKFGEKKGKQSVINNVDSNKDDLRCEIEFLEELIKDYENMSTKTIKEWEYMHSLQYKVKKLKGEL